MKRYVHITKRNRRVWQHRLATIGALDPLKPGRDVVVIEHGHPTYRFRNMLSERGDHFRGHRDGAVWQ